VSQTIEGSLTSLEVFPCHVVLRNNKTLTGTKIMNSQIEEEGEYAKILMESLLNLHQRLQVDPSQMVLPID
jgi:hypothetical protein